MTNRDTIIALYAPKDVEQGLRFIEQVTSPGAVAHNLFPGAPPGREGVKAGFLIMRNTFPDASFTIERLVAEGDSVAARVRMNGTHLGTAMGIPPTGRAIELCEHIFFRFEGGQIVESWALRDDAAMMRQLAA